MNTLLLTCSCDSLVAKMSANACACSQKAVEQGANWEDVTITGIICCSILIILLVPICKYFGWKKYELKEKKNEDAQRRTWEMEDKAREQKSDLLDSRLRILKEMCDTDNYKNADDTQRDKIRADVEEYIEAVNDVIDKLNGNASSQADEEGK